ncbi:MAG: Hsp20/alpha crystallin family protein [Lachnospiraceae bacterium]|nr:Hsp20/alpha crystallin family protein [Lachnospiraceae bacterium]
MYAPSIFEDRFMNNFMNDFFGKPISAMNRMANPMRTDIVEKDGDYFMSVEMPGFKKEEIKAELKDGYLTLSAAKNEDSEQKDDEGNVVYRERHTGEYRRSYFVGKHLKESDIKANFEDGVLKLQFPSEKKKPVEDAGRLISIQ